MCVTRFGEKYLNRVFKFSISQIEIFLFHFSVFDILFLPYMSRMAMAYSQIPIFIWFLLQKRNIFNRKDFSDRRSSGIESGGSRTDHGTASCTGSSKR